MNTLLFYIAIAVVEILGCYQPWHWMKQQARRVCHSLLPASRFSHGF
ncbi:MAG: hypothetical protein WAV82_09940 [Methylobacter sp.]